MYWPEFLIKTVVVEKKYSDSELLLMVAERLGDIDSLSVVDEKDEARIYTGLANVDGVVDLLRDTMLKDMRRYFAVPDGETGEGDRKVIRGGFARTAHWMAKILKIKE